MFLENVFRLNNNISDTNFKFSIFLSAVFFGSFINWFIGSRLEFRYFFHFQNEGEFFEN